MIKTGETQNALISLVRKAKAELSAMFTLISIGDEWKKVLDLPKTCQVEVVINVNPPKRER
jgi:adenine/guanine phosphoribosyltransferase-like PRPP-binding protein